MLHGQTFSWIDLPFVLILAVVELLLSADNAGVLAWIVKSLPQKKRVKALYAGLFSAVAFRLIGIFIASYLIWFFWMQWIGGAYLLYLAVSHIKNDYPKTKKIQKEPSFWKVVYKIEFMDILFAIDSILAAFALAALYYPNELLPGKLWVIYLGGVLGLIMMRVATTKIMAWFDKRPRFEKVIFCLVGWMGIKLILEGVFHFLPPTRWISIIDIVFCVGAVLILVIGFLSTKCPKRV